MKLFVVIKAPVDLDGTAEVIGAFRSKPQAEAACLGAGTFTIAGVEIDQVYRGNLFDVEIVKKLDHRQF